MNCIRTFISIFVLLCFSLTIMAEEFSKREKKPIDVFVKEIQMEEIYDSLIFGGFIEPNASYDIGSEILGNLHKLHVKLGQTVNPGETLFEILPSSSGFEYQLNRVQSPIKGIISNIHKRIGNWVQQGDIIVSVTDDSKLKSTIHVTYDDLPYLKTAVPISATIGFENEEHKTLTATVDSISPMADAVTGTYAVSLLLSCNMCPLTRCSETFRVGALLKVTVKKNFREGIKVPITYLHDQRKKVLLMDKKGRAKWVNITAGSYYGQDIEIVSGLNHGMRVVTGYAQKPEEGDLLVVVEEKKNGSF